MRLSHFRQRKSLTLNVRTENAAFSFTEINLLNFRRAYSNELNKEQGSPLTRPAERTSIFTLSANHHFKGERSGSADHNERARFRAPWAEMAKNHTHGAREFQRLETKNARFPHRRQRPAKLDRELSIGV